MAIPLVVIVGRPNVGKSSLFNWLARKRLAIVDPTAGVTRDRLTHLVSHQEQYFEIVDTGGIGFDDPDNLTQQINDQIRAGLEAANLLLFVVDARTGHLPADQQIAHQLHDLGKPVLLVMNKADDARLDLAAGDFHRLGYESFLCVSTLQNRGREELLDALVAALPPESRSDEDFVTDPTMKVAIVGRRNVGKSTFVNTLAQEERVIVSEIPGTTRDSVDVRFELDGKSFIAIDTAGVRRRKSVSTDIDFYSLHRAQRSIRRADVVLLFFDAEQEISKVDKQLCDYIATEHKACIFVVNKWDLMVGKLATEQWADYLRHEFRTMEYVPIAFITGQTGKNVKTLLNHAQMLHKQSQQRLSTGELNRLLRAALERNPPPLFHGRLPKIFFATQIAIAPPTIVLFANEPQGFSEPYRRYLLGFLRDQSDYAEIPIKLYIRKRQSHDHKSSGPESVAEEAVDS